MLVPVGRLAIVRTFDKADLVRAMSFVSIPALIGPMLGPMAGGLIVGYLHWRVTFFVNIPIGLIGLFMVYLHLPDYREEHRNPLDAGGLILFGSGIALLSYVLEVFGEHTLSGVELLAGLVIAILLLAGSGWHATRAGFPMLTLTLFRIRTFRSAVNGNFLTRLGIGGIPFLFPLLYQIGLGLTPIQSGLLMEGMVPEVSQTGEKKTQMPTGPKFADLNGPELFRTTWREAAKSNISERAAELAFWFLLGFFPMLLCVVSMVSTLNSASASQTILMKYLAEVLPSAASNLVRQVLAQTASSGRAWFALLFALWSSSSATAGLIDTLNEIYGVKESRPWWQRRLMAVSLALAMGVLLSAALTIVVYGPAILRLVLNVPSTLLVLKIAQWPVAAFLLISALLGLYRFAPNIRQQRLKWLLPGSVFAAVVWMVASILFKVYVRHFSHFGLLYGSRGCPICS